MDSIILSELKRHQQRREQGLPTVSILSGPSGLSIPIWRKFTQLIGRVTIISRNIEIDHVINDWLLGYQDSHNLAFSAVKHLANFQNIEEQDALDHLRHLSSFEKKLYLETAFRSVPQNSVNIICQHILLNMEFDTNGKPSILTQKILNSHKFNDFDILKGIDCLIPKWTPALLIAGGNESDESFETLYSRANLAVSYAEELPGCPIAWAVSHTNLDYYFSQATESRQKAICRETVCRLEMVNPSYFNNKLPVSDSKRGDLEKSIQRLSADGISDELSDNFIQLVHKIHSNSTPSDEEAEQARSMAESFLYARLESLAETAGLFHLNQKVSIPFGTHRVMEIDLLCEKYKVAIEIDGYYHFQNPDSYRRDRRKDYLLQKNHFFVLRFLADDVVGYLEIILDTILETLSLSRAKINEKDN